jgi:uncharacterized protein
VSNASFKAQSQFISTLNKVEKTRLLRVQLKREQALRAKRDAAEQSQQAIVEHKDEQIKLLSTQDAIVQMTQSGFDLLLFGAECKKRSIALDSIAKSHAASIQTIKEATKQVQDSVIFEQRSIEKLATLSKMHRLNSFSAETVVAELEQEDLSALAKRLEKHG